MRGSRRKFGLLIITILTTLLFLWNHKKYSSGLAEKALYQELHLIGNLSTTETKREAIVKHYTSNMFNQMKDRLQQYKVADETVYTQRKEHLNAFCKRRNQKLTSNLSTIDKVMWYIQNPGIFFCPIAKGGSTFWRRVLEVINRKQSSIFSPFQLSYGDFKQSEAKTHIDLNQPEGENKMKTLLNSSLKFIFARNPYKRVFSTFVDKVLSPNGYMWGLGRAAVLKFRPNATKEDVCGSEVTFQEFVKYLNTQPSRKYDAHLRPVAYACQVCELQLDVIGKMETFQTDTLYILSRAEVLNREVVFHDLGTEYKVDQMVDNVVRAFAFKHSWTRCLSVHSGLQRLWRQLQISGLIDKTDTYPLSSQQSELITVTEFLNMCFTMFKRSSPETSRNKREAFLQAYSMLSLSDIEELKEKYIDDFEMFDYDQRPKDLFERKESISDFDYFDVMKLR